MMRLAKIIFVSLAICGAASSAPAITVADLQKKLAAGERLTVIDLRDTKLYAEAHIPGAINVPASLCPIRNFPPLGAVVIYDDGLGRRGQAALNAAAAALAAKNGIAVDILAGGFAAWEGAASLTTRAAGLKPESLNYITYAQLQAADPRDVALLDMRRTTAAVLKSAGGLSDLAKEFPGRRIVSAAPKPQDGAPLVVLIDSGDGSAQAQARALKLSGVRRYAILVGGELTIARKGLSGLARNGASMDSPLSVQKPSTGAPSQ